MAEEKTSIWKKEITLRRKPKASKEAPVAQTPVLKAEAEEQTSIWKKEITLRRKPKVSKGERAEAKRLAAERKAAEEAARAEQKAVLKAEAAEQKAAEKAARRKPKVSKQERAEAKRLAAEQKAAERAARAEEKVAGKVAAQAAQTVAEEKTSIWKKEITFRRKPKAAPVEAAVSTPEPAPEAPRPEPVALPPRVAPVPPRPEPAVEAARPEPVAQSPREESAGPRLEPAVRSDQPQRPASAVPGSPVAGVPPLPATPPSPPVPPAFPPAAEAVSDTEITLVSSEPAVPEPPVVPVAPSGPAAPDLSDLVAAAERALQEEQEPVAPSESPTVVLPPSESPTVLLPVAEPVAEQVEEPASEAPAEKGRRRFSLRGAKAAKSARRERGNRRGAKKIVGIKVGASQIAAARVSNNGSIELQQVARTPLEPGIVVAGELRDPDALAAALKQFFRKNKLPRRGIRLGISNNRIGVRVFDISGVEDGDQFRNAVRFRAQDALPIPVDEAVLDYHVVGEAVDEQGSVTKRVVLVVAYRDLVDRYVAAFRKAGLKLTGIDLEAFALLRALGAPPDEQVAGERSGLVVVSVGHDRSTFAVSDGRVCEFTRVLDWGGAALDMAIARAVDLTPAEAAAVKFELSLADASAVPANLTAEQAEAARASVGRALEAFARDLVSSLRFYQSQPDSLPIRELVLSGGTAGLPGLAEELSRLLDVRVRVGDPLSRIKVGRKVKDREGLGSLAAAIGLGIED